MVHIRRRVLIVEDEEILAENLRDFLTRRDAQVCVVPNAETALEEALRFGPEDVVVDYSLPGMNGLEAFLRLKAHEPALRGVLISGHPTEQLRESAAGVGIQHVLTKPFAFAEIERVLAAREPGEFGPEDHDDRHSHERRRNHAHVQFPLGTPEGWILHDRRASDRRAPAGNPVAEFSSPGIMAA